MELINQTHLITALIVIAVFIGGIFVAMSKARFVTKDECDDKCDGTEKLATKKDCEKKHNNLTNTLCGKIDIVQRDVSEVKTDIDKMEKSIAQFTFFMGQVSQYMTDQSSDKPSKI